MTLKVFAVTCVRNEIDIIEAFIRHNSHYFDRMLIEDNGSTDGTYERLCALRDENIAIDVERSRSVSHLQAQSVTRLTRLAVERFGADWVMPLDADEFVEPPLGTTLREVLASMPQSLVKVGWSGFAWRREDHASTETNPVLRLTARLPVRKEHTKAIIPAAVVRRYNFQVTTGSHGVYCDGVDQESLSFTGFELCHFPIRSPDQYTSKIVINYLRHRASDTYEHGMGFQYDEPFLLAKQGVSDLLDVMERQSRRYSAVAAIDDQVTIAPLRYVGGPLSHDDRSVRPLSNILNFAEDMAMQIAQRSRSPRAAAS